MAQELNLTRSYVSELENNRKTIQEWVMQRLDILAKRPVSMRGPGVENPTLQEGSAEPPTDDDCRAYLDLFLERCGGRPDRLGWTYITLKETFPLNKWEQIAAASSGFSSISPSQAAESVSAAERAVDYERRSRSRSRGAGEPSERKSAPSPGASPGAKGPPTPPKQVPE